jgi:hypothetical protein
MGISQLIFHVSGNPKSKLSCFSFRAGKGAGCFGRGSGALARIGGGRSLAQTVFKLAGQLIRAPQRRGRFLLKRRRCAICHPGTTLADGD